MDCPHLNFRVDAKCNRIQKSDLEPDIIVAYTADIEIKCHDCGQPFEFLGLPNGMSFYQPTVSINGQEGRFPIAIPGTRPPEGLAGFRVTHSVFPEGEVVKQ